MAINKIRYQGVDYNLDINDKYSTEEQIIGTWIDGKPIYRKVIESSSTGEIKHGISDINCVVKVNASLIRNGGIMNVMPNGIPNDAYYLSIQDITKTDVVIGKGSEFQGDLAITKIFIIMEYTKTTD